MPQRASCSLVPRLMIHWGGGGGGLLFGGGGGGEDQE